MKTAQKTRVKRADLKWPSRRYQEVLNEADTLVKEIRACAPHADGILPRGLLRAVEECQFHRDITDTFAPPFAALRRVLDLFEGIGPERQKAALGGWLYEPAPPSSEILEQLDNISAAVSAILNIEAKESWQETARASLLEHVIDDRVAPVKVTIRRGTSKDCAIQHLLNVIAAISHAWPDMITHRLPIW